MKISIAMASYNGEKYLAEQIDSFVSQTRLPDELVITDDGSTDSTIEILEAYKDKVPFEMIFLQNDSNLGYSGNFNKALGLTTGDLVFLSDQDDVWFDNKLEVISKLAAEQNDKFLFMNDASLTDSNLNEAGLTKIGQMNSSGMGLKHFVMGCCCAVKRELLDLILPIPKSYSAHDTWLVKIAQGLDVRYVTQQVLQYYRRHGNNESKFIANNLRKVNKLDLFSTKLKTDIDTRLIKDYEDIGQLIKGIDEAIKRESIFDKRLGCMKNELEINQKKTFDRINIRRLPFLKRFTNTITFLKDGGYSDGTGVQSAIRDIVRF